MNDELQGIVDEDDRVRPDIGITRQDVIDEIARNDERRKRRYINFRLSRIAAGEKAKESEGFNRFCFYSGLASLATAGACIYCACKGYIDSETYAGVIVTLIMLGSIGTMGGGAGLVCLPKQHNTLK